MDGYCTEDKDCPETQVCKENACKPKDTTVKCSNNSDCKDGKICEQGECVTKQEQTCKKDGDCTDGTCVEGKCKPNEPECNTDSECSGDLVCREHKCVEECQEDTDCNEELVCKNHKCVEECQNDTDCDGDLVCKDHHCKPDCEKKEDCEPDFVCSEQNKCIPACQNDESCDESYICVDEFCVKDPLWCVFDKDCPGNNYVCDISNHCVDPSIHCYEDNECAGVLVCRDHKCLPECKSDTDCTDGMVCRGQQCQPECTDNSQCAAPKYCKNMHCTKECTLSSECPTPYLCISNQCAYQCANNSDCDGSLICSGHRCVECGVDADCGAEKVCHLNVCENSKDIRYPCLISLTPNTFTTYKTETGYQAALDALNIDGSINLCRLGYHPSENEIAANSAMDKCIPLYTARDYDFYGDGVDSNCDGYDYSLVDAIFVSGVFQGTQSGDDANSGNYDVDLDRILAKATIKSAFQHSNKLYSTGNGSVSILPDILVAKNAEKTLNEPLVIPAGSGYTLDSLPQLESVSTESGQTAFSVHTHLVKEILSDNSKNVQDYGFYTEGNYPKEKIRVYGGFTRNPLNDGNYKHWQRVDENHRTKLEYVVSEITEDSYALMLPESKVNSLNFALNYFELSISSTAQATPHGTTLVGFTCGKAGCQRLNLEHTKWTVTAPNGISRTETLDNGDDGIAGKNGIRGFNYDSSGSLYNEVSWCPETQICSGTESTGTGGCAGHIAKVNKNDGDNSNNYDGSSDGRYNGMSGANGLSIMSSTEQTLAAGGTGGAGTSYGQITIDQTCGNNSSVDPNKTKGSDGGDGANGRNGSHANLSMTLTPTSDHTMLYLASDYDTLEELHGSDGGQGGGGGGGGVYQAHSSWSNDPSWIIAGTGGNGGCGGKGGQPGGTGGSAIGLILNVPSTGNASFSLEHSEFLVTAGNGGTAQSGSDGGTGGNGGNEIGYGYREGGVDRYCDKATAGGKGGHGGGGGAGAGGVAGHALTYVLACNRNVVANCAQATTSKPCFNAENRDTLKNCGYQMPASFLINYDSPAFGTATPGKTISDANPEDDVAGVGSTAGTTQTNGVHKFLTTWIGAI